jgi:hypothetical protein
MLTLRLINVDGREIVVTLASVSFDPEQKILIGHGTPSGDQTWTHGRAFVMNHHGKTVATYTLNQKQEKSE